MENRYKVLMGAMILVLSVQLYQYLNRVPEKEKVKIEEDFKHIIKSPEKIEEILVNYNFSEKRIIKIVDKNIIKKICLSSIRNYGKVPSKSSFDNIYIIKLKIRDKYYEYRFSKRYVGDLNRKKKLYTGKDSSDFSYINNPLDDLGQLSLFMKPYSKTEKIANSIGGVISYDHIDLIPVFEKYIDPKFRKMIKEHRKRKSK